MRWFKRRDAIIDAILNDLKSEGYVVDSLDDVGVVGDPPHSANAILARWVGKVPPKYTGPLHQAMARVSEKTTPPEPKRTMPQLLQEFQARATDVNTGFTSYWSIGDAIFSKYSDRYFDEIAALAADRGYGADRQMIVLSLGKSKRPEAVSVLLDLLDDYDVSGHATEALAKLRSEEAREGLSKMVSDNRAWVRTQARRGLKLLDGLQGSV